MTHAQDAAESASVPIACSLSTGDLRRRLDDWQELLAKVTERQPIDGGLRLTFSRSATRAVVADLAVREHACCPFFDFAVDPGTEEPVLEVRAPAEAQEILYNLFGGNA